MDVDLILYVGAIVAFFLAFCYKDARQRTIQRAKCHGIIIGGEHYKVYRVFRCESVTVGGLYEKFHGIHDFGEVLLVSPEGEEKMTTVSRLLFCLRKRKHGAPKIINGEKINRWSIWEIDPNGSDERGLNTNEIYLGF